MATQATKKVKPASDAVKALAAEATNSTSVTVEFRGETLTIDTEALDDYELIEQLTQGVPMLALSVFVPDSEQRSRLLETCEKNARGGPKLTSVVEMAGEIMTAVGAGK